MNIYPNGKINKDMINMKFFEKITEQEVNEYDKRIDSKQKQGEFAPKHLRIRLNALKYYELRQIIAYFKKECGITISKSDLLYVGLMELIENNPDAKSMIKTLGKYDKI